MPEETRKLRIALAKTAKAALWTNREVTWAQMLNALRKDKATGETMAEYLAMDKDRQASIKDVGGFVGGELIGGVRRSGHVKCRSMVTLDVDDMTAEDLAMMEVYIDRECYAYGTHKHTPKKPRIRLVIPLTRDVTESEYEPVARMLAKKLVGSLEPVDPTCYRTTQMMYWASHPKDIEPYAKRFEGPWADPDELLREYKDWRNVAEWPYSAKETRRRPYASGKKLGDPAEKPGIVGAFCAAYSISEAIDEFLSDVYAPAGRDRYTYLNGSTHGGAIVFEDKYLYSNHSTDPAMGMSLNAFDLCRIHLYGDLDEGAKEGTPVNRLPSFAKMSERAAEDPRVKEELAKRNEEKHPDAAEDFESFLKRGEEEAETGQAEDPNAWKRQKLRWSQDGNRIINCVENIQAILSNHPALKGLVGINEMTDAPELRKPAPWDEKEGWKRRIWTDADDAQLRVFLSKNFMQTKRADIEDCLLIEETNNAFDPIIEFIEEEEWDGVERAADSFRDYLGADASDYVRACAKTLFLGAIQRAYEPGCQFEYTVTFVGSQGCGKSQFLKKIAKGYYSDNLGDISKKDAAENLAGVWIMELAELAAFDHKSNEEVKSFLTRFSDDFRKAYAKRKSVNPRRCIFVGTTNRQAFITDKTGGRRFLPIDCHPERAAKLPAYEDEALDPRTVRQLWAEAKSWYDSGLRVWDVIKPILPQAEEEQRKHMSDNSFEGMISAYLETPICEGWEKMNMDARHDWYQFRKYEEGNLSEGTTLTKRNAVSAMEVLIECLDYEKKNCKPRDVDAVIAILNSLPDWEVAPGSGKRDRGAGYGKVKTYIRKDTQQ